MTGTEISDQILENGSKNAARKVGDIWAVARVRIEFNILLRRSLVRLFYGKRFGRSWDIEESDNGRHRARLCRSRRATLPRKSRIDRALITAAGLG
jgi:hypothetical protein